MTKPVSFSFIRTITMKNRTRRSLTQRVITLYTEAEFWQTRNGKKFIELIIKAVHLVYKLTLMRIEDTQKRLRRLTKKRGPLRRQKKIKKLSARLRKLFIDKEVWCQEEERHVALLPIFLACEKFLKEEFPTQEERAIEELRIHTAYERWELQFPEKGYPKKKSTE